MTACRGWAHKMAAIRDLSRHKMASVKEMANPKLPLYPEIDLAARILGGQKVLVEINIMPVLCFVQYMYVYVLFIFECYLVHGAIGHQVRYLEAPGLLW